VHFDEMYRFCGPKGANNGWARNVDFSGRRETAPIGLYFSAAVCVVPFPFGQLILGQVKSDRQQSVTKRSLVGIQRDI
jgi:hypothetical protein